MRELLAENAEDECNVMWKTQTRKEVNTMDSGKMLAILGAMSVAAAVVPAVSASADSKKASNQDGLVLYSGTQAQGQNVTWHSSHGSHTSHSSHSSSRY